ncbi:hypothetical protein [Massilia sp. BJB1822]|uniref:hypothetical protein n=1 Tax=Massilia sp. BJB1822 TaxID=2744470 RepID=UPI0015931427|nr:hypothetical protein [Massilia sp. BJB1822]NVE00374.1 hypothetical protein [Massilia sp. BJB1822]
MLQQNEMRVRFNSLQFAIGQAAQACSAERNLPGELRNCIQKLDKQSDTMVGLMASSDNERIQRILVDMEVLGKRAKTVCGSGLPVSGQLKSAVNQMHGELCYFRECLN